MSDNISILFSLNSFKEKGGKCIMVPKEISVKTEFETLTEDDTKFVICENS